MATLEEAGKFPPVTGPTVIVLHGLGEGRRSMRPLVDFLRKNIDATVLSFGYASTSTGIDDHGRALADVIQGLPAADSISFVGHSMGNLVVRRWMGLAAEDDLARVRRMVMLGPPNQGSELAQMVAKIGVLAALSNGSAAGSRQKRGCRSCFTTSVTVPARRRDCWPAQVCRGAERRNEPTPSRRRLCSPRGSTSRSTAVATSAPARLMPEETARLP